MTVWRQTASLVIPAKAGIHLHPGVPPLSRGQALGPCFRRGDRERPHARLPGRDPKWKRGRYVQVRWQGRDPESIGSRGLASMRRRHAT